MDVGGFAAVAEVWSVVGAGFAFGHGRVREKPANPGGCKP